MNTKALPLSTREPLPGYRAVRAANPDEVIEVTIKLRRVKEISDQQVLDLAAKTPGERSYLTQEELAKTYGASADDISKVGEFAHEHGLAIVSEDQGARAVKLSGSVAAMQQAFGVDLKIYQHGTTGRTYRGRVGMVHVPEELSEIVESVHGLDNREQAVPHFRVSRQSGRRVARKKATSRANAAAASSFTSKQVAALYDFPNATGKNQTIALIELGGGYRKSDLTHYFKSLGVKSPSVTAVSVHGAANHPTGDPTGPDGEVVLDIQVAGGVATEANYAVYFAHNTDKGFLDAITAAVHDTKRKPSIISISWGQAEIGWSDQSIQAFNEVFKEAALQGISVLVASGDDGSNDNVNDGQNHVDFPSSSPFALACGGTRLIAGQNNIQDETTWGGMNDGASGGGTSDVFDTPSYQQTGIQPPLAHRGVPDVAGDADPETGYNIFVDGTAQTFGGTSAVAPLYAALIAQINEQINGRCGMLHPFLYGNPTVCRDITQGTNGSFNAATGWDATTGLGSIKGNDLLARLSTAKRKAA